jgi:DNA-directed RNA polymerase specialized sigma24 family protein
MEWFHSTERDKQERPQGSLASSHEIQSAFVEQRDHLNWIALLITGDRALADQAVINASDLSASNSSVFRDWLMRWTNTLTVRAAVREVRDLISASASRYIDSSCEHPDNDVLSDDQIESLRHVDTGNIVAALDPLARSALVLRGIQHFSIAECALLLDMPRQMIAAAYCQALRWNNKRADAQGAPNEDGAIPSPLITPAETEPSRGGKRETVQRINKTEIRTRYRTEW